MEHKELERQNESNDNCGMTDLCSEVCSEQEIRLERNAELMKEIVNLLAENKCTVQDAEDILHGVKVCICNTALLQTLQY